MWRWRRGAGSLRGRALATILLLALSPTVAAIQPAAAAEPGVAAPEAADHHGLAPGITPAALVDPLALNDEMRRWLAKEVPTYGSEEDRLAALLEAVQGRLDLKYDPWATLTAAEVFAQRRYNCLAFAHLLIALGRAVGLDTHYLEARTSSRYEREGDLVLLSGHVTAAADGTAGVRRVIDLGLGRYDYRNGRRLPDAHALALHYTNLGAAELRGGRIESALSPLLTAVTVGPEVGAAWVNLGVALRRRGDNAGAEVAYERAIAAEPGMVTAYDNLYLLLVASGRRDAATELMRAVPNEAKRNPWLLLSLGDSCLQVGDLAGARRFYRLARSLAPRDAAPAAALAAWHLRNGDQAAARRWWRRARAADPEEPRLVPLRRRFAPPGPVSPGTTETARTAAS
jgi:Flp pilus assembly protein TadD